MLFAVSLVLALCFACFCGESLRKHPAPFYIAAAILSIGAVCLVNIRISGIPSWISQYPAAMLTKGTLATACWAVVMWTGALPNGSALMKRLMPPRGQLSIFAAILTLGHGVGYGISYLPRWIRKGDALNLTVCIVLMLIMIPLTVISVRRIRRSMKPRKWKQVHRFAYIFYVLIPVHVIALNLQRARAGRTEAQISLAVYLTVFLGYAVCRLRKWYLTAKKPQTKTVLNAAAAAGFVVPFACLMLFIAPKKQPETVPERVLAVPEETRTSETALTEAGTTVSTLTEITQTIAETLQTDITGETADQESEFTEGQTTAAVLQTQETAGGTESSHDTSVSRQESVSTTKTTVSTTVAVTEKRVWKNGTFTGKAYGYDGEITVHVTIADDIITAITAETDESDDSYFFDAKGKVIREILSSQRTDVDAFTGATYSSEGIMAAVSAALKQAKN